MLKAYDVISNPDKIIVTTEKDAVRLRTDKFMKEFGPTPLFYLPIDIRIHDEKAFEDSIIGSLKPLNPKKPVTKLPNQIN